MGEEALAAERHAMMDEADRMDGRAAVVAARRDHIRDMAACTDCGAPRKLCEHLRATNTDRTAPKWFGCCAVGTLMSPCRHVESKAALTELLDEVLTGSVRTVAEVDPAPVQGPEMPRMSWLLDQTEWWYPKRRPAVRVAEMDKTYRYNTLKWLERRAQTLHGTVGGRYLAGAPDEVWADWEREARDPIGWLHQQPLVKALRKGLPTGGRKLAALQERAKHWSTCPMRLRAEARPPFASCTCVPGPAAEGGRADRAARPA